MSSEVVHRFPIFPLGLVALPHELVPLHIFEERYKTMITECLAGSSEFGIVWAGDHGLRMSGCAVRVEEVLEQFDDGRLNIVARGTRRLHLLDDELEAVPYPAGTVEFVADKDEDVEPATRDEAHEAYAKLVEAATDKILEPDELADLGSYEMAATVDFGLDAKQGLLDLRSENARLRLVTRLFRAALRRLDFVERAEVRAKSNGKVRFS